MGNYDWGCSECGAKGSVEYGTGDTVSADDLLPIIRDNHNAVSPDCAAWNNALVQHGFIKRMRGFAKIASGIMDIISDTVLKKYTENPADFPIGSAEDLRESIAKQVQLIDGMEKEKDDGICICRHGIFECQECREEKEKEA